jgi:hypothetical protein
MQSTCTACVESLNIRDDGWEKTRRACQKQEFLPVYDLLCDCRHLLGFSFTTLCFFSAWEEFWLVFSSKSLHQSHLCCKEAKGLFLRLSKRPNKRVQNRVMCGKIEASGLAAEMSSAKRWLILGCLLKNPIKQTSTFWKECVIQFFTAKSYANFFTYLLVKPYRKVSMHF